MIIEKTILLIKSTQKPLISLNISMVYLNIHIPFFNLTKSKYVYKNQLLIKIDLILIFGIYGKWSNKKNAQFLVGKFTDFAQSFHLR